MHTENETRITNTERIISKNEEGRLGERHAHGEEKRYYGRANESVGRLYKINDEKFDLHRWLLNLVESDGIRTLVVIEFEPRETTDFVPSANIWRENKTRQKKCRDICTLDIGFIRRMGYVTDSRETFGNRGVRREFENKSRAVEKTRR